MDLKTSNNAAGFSLIETLVVAGIVAIGASMAVVQTGNTLSHYRGNSGLRAVQGQLSVAKSMAVKERRNMVVQCVAPNQIQIVRQNIPAGTTIVSTTTLEGGVQFGRQTGIPDTPEAFGNTADCYFGATTTSIAFTPEATLVDQNGVPVNGTIFLLFPGDAKTIRAMTVMGASGRLRGFRWNGSQWDNP
jgi:prepilin-type N-terminal cleavage/methylation domain-containing protein